MGRYRDLWSKVLDLPVSLVTWSCASRLIFLHWAREMSHSKSSHTMHVQPAIMCEPCFQGLFPKR